jgi:hypothetical protein
LKILLHRYHPIVDDLAIAFELLGHSVTVCINTAVEDHYGKSSEILSNLKIENFGENIQYISLKEACVKIVAFDLIGFDGVFSGDEILRSLCKKAKKPYFAISGYPYLRNEEANNILSFSWFMPQIQFVSQYPSESHVKMDCWSKIKKNVPTTKNFCVFYPELFTLHRQLSEIPDAYERSCVRDQNPVIVSSIHRFEECNPENYAVFEEVSKASKTKVENITSMSRVESWKRLAVADKFLHLKSFDCPGISLIEAMKFGVVPVVMREFILGSFDQDLLIDNHSAIVCDSIGEIKERINEKVKDSLRYSTKDHVNMLTSFERQRGKLEIFVQKCLKDRHD